MRYCEILRDTTSGTTGGTTIDTVRHCKVLRVVLRVTRRYYEILSEVLQDSEDCGTRSYEISWHCKNDE